jgi:hypothetical protein
LKANPGLNISVEGHCDTRNTDEYNIELGDNRATAAYKYLLRKGVSDARLITVSYGERRPAAPNDSPENMQLNRRVEFRVILKEGETAPTINPVSSAATPPTSSSNSMGSANNMGGGTTSTASTVPLQPGKTKMKQADGTKIKTKVDEDSDKVKIKAKGPNGEEAKTKAKNGTIDSKAKDANGEKTKVKTDSN